MELHQETTGSFASFRDSLIEDYRAAKQAWLDYSTETEKVTDEKERAKRIINSLMLMDKMDEIEAELHELECEQVQHKLGNHLISLGVECYNTILANQRAWKTAELARLDDLRKNGVSYHERMKLINAERIKTILAVDKGDITTKDIELKPIKDWLDPIKGYDKLKELGVTEFVRRNFSFIYNVKK